MVLTDNLNDNLICIIDRVEGVAALGKLRQSSVL